MLGLPLNWKEYSPDPATKLRLVADEDPLDIPSAPVTYVWGVNESEGKKEKEKKMAKEVCRIFVVGPHRSSIRSDLYRR